MKLFKDWLKEDWASIPVLDISAKSPDIHDEDVRSKLNGAIWASTDTPFPTPYTALEYIRKCLAWAAISVPAVFDMDEEVGEKIFICSQYGFNAMDDENDPDPIFLYFCWVMNDIGDYDVYGELVDQEDLDDLLSDDEFYDEEGFEEPIEESYSFSFANDPYLSIGHEKGKPATVWLMNPNGRLDTEYVADGRQEGHAEKLNSHNWFAVGRYDPEKNLVSVAFPNPKNPLMQTKVRNLANALDKKFPGAQTRVCGIGSAWAKSLDDLLSET